MGGENPSYPVTIYAQEINKGMYTALQYWMFYVYNDWKSTHEGDWESITVYLRSDKPIAIAASAHHGGYRLPWNMIKTMGDHPKIFIANGSHANYFDGGMAYKTNVKAFNSYFPIGELPFIGSFKDYTTTVQAGVTLHPDIKLLDGPIEKRIKSVKIWGSVGRGFLTEIIPSFIRKRFLGGLWEAPSSPMRKYRYEDPFLWLEKCIEAPVPFWLNRIKNHE